MTKSSILSVLFPLATASSLEAATLVASDAASNDFFAYSVSVSGNIGFVGNYGDDISTFADRGSAYLFRNLDTLTETGNVQNAKLVASDGTPSDFLGYAVSVSGTIGLAGAYGDRPSFVGQGSAYVFRNLDTASGTATESAKLIASGADANNFFGSAVSVSGTIGLVGAYGYVSTPGTTNNGTAYVFRNLDTATGTVTQNARLTGSNGDNNAFFGAAVSLSGNVGLVGAYGMGVVRGRVNSPSGAAFLYRDLNTATGTVSFDAILTASDGAADDFFGFSVSLSGNSALVGAYGDDIGANSNQGSAYLYRNLNTAALNTNQEHAKLTASDGATDDLFGASVAISGNTALVGAHGDNLGRGAVYLFTGLDTATGTITQNVKINLQGASGNTNFGRAVSIDGDLFLIGAPGAGSINKAINGGVAYGGNVSTLTTLDAGSAIRTVEGFNFSSWDDWIIGKTTDSNSVTLAFGQSATVAQAGKAVYIGKDAGSDSNSLVLNGALTATNVYVGAAGNSNNVLQIDSGGSLSVGSTIINNGTVIFSRSSSTTQGTNFGTAGISGTGSIVKNETTTLTFNANNTYTGPTTINAGTLTLAATGSIAASSAIDIKSGATFNVSAVSGGWALGASQTLKGAGRVTGAATIVGTHAPGNDSIGKQAFSGNLSYSSASLFAWELAPNKTGNSVGTRGTNYDAVNVGGTLSGTDAVFKAILTTGSFSDAFWSSERTWNNIFTNTTETTPLSFAGIFSRGIEYWEGSTNVTSTVNNLGRFTLSGSTLTWSAVPEPSSTLGGLLLLAGLMRRRRERA